jgi:hypothetical protein
MDHKNLEYFQKSQKLNRRQTRWSLYLSQFDFALFHQPRHLMGCPDALSRRLDHGAGSENSDITLLRPELFRICAMEGTAVDGREIPLLRDVWKVFAKPEGSFPSLGRMADLRRTLPVLQQDRCAAD